MNDAREALLERLPSASLTAEELRARSWWKGSDLYLIVDDYDLVAGATNPLLPIMDLLPQARDIGLHVVLARSAGGAGRAMFEPVVQRLREMGTPTLLMSASKDEGQLFGVKPQALPAGRGFLVARRGAPAWCRPRWPARRSRSERGPRGPPIRSGDARVSAQKIPDYGPAPGTRPPGSGRRGWPAGRQCRRRPRGIT